MVIVLDLNKENFAENRNLLFYSQKAKTKSVKRRVWIGEKYFIYVGEGKAVLVSEKSLNIEDNRGENIFEKI